MQSIWESITNAFTLLLRFLNRWVPNRLVSQAPQNSYPFGTREWSAFAASQATDHELMVLRVADLEAQVQQTGELVHSLEALAASQDATIRDLRLQNRNLRDGPDPEVFQRLWDQIHEPLPKPTETGGTAPSSAPAAPDAESTPARESTPASGGGPERSQETAAGQKKPTPTRPLTLAEELEGHDFEDSDSEEGS